MAEVTFTGQEFDQLSEGARAAIAGTVPKKYDLSGVYSFVAMEKKCNCIKAFTPFSGDKKANGRIVLEWVKAGYRIGTIPKFQVHVPNCKCEEPQDIGKLVHVAELFCGCVAGTYHMRDGEEVAAAKTIQQWVETGKYIQNSHPNMIVNSGDCPHFPAKPKQRRML